MGAEAPSGTAKEQHRSRRQQRSAAERDRKRYRHRPRHDLAARSHPRPNRQYALRRFRTAAGVDDLQRSQPVSRRHGGGAALLAGSKLAAGRLREHRRRPGQRDGANRVAGGRGRVKVERQFPRQRLGQFRAKLAYQRHRQFGQGKRVVRRRRQHGHRDDGALDQLRKLQARNARPWPSTIRDRSSYRQSHSIWRSEGR